MKNSMPNGTTPDKKISDKAVHTFRRHWHCPRENCRGEMIETGHSWRLTYLNQCNNCGYQEWAGHAYPCDERREEE
jgi:hypothetical protein